MKSLIMILLSLLLVFTSCSTHFGNFEVKESTERSMSDDRFDDLSYYLSIDKFKYYINEYTFALEEKIPNEIQVHLRSLSVNDLLALNLSRTKLLKAANYDELIYQYLKSKNLLFGKKPAELAWGYNFFKNKLDEGFQLAPSRLDIELQITGIESPTAREIPIDATIYTPDEMTLDSGHYISNRTTRAVFWEAIENDRTVEFHLGDAREFLKTLKTQGGEILYTVKPLARSYNKIYVVKYPGESEFRYAITNIGGADRLAHLTHQLSLSNFKNYNRATKVVVKGDVKKFHEIRLHEHIMQLKLLPAADRVIIGQKESIDGKFYIFWKMRALKNLYDDDPARFNQANPELIRKFKNLEAAPFETVFKDKKVVEDLFAFFENTLTEDSKYAPPKFKMYNYDNFTIEMADYVFKNHSGKEIRWRVISNVWGDEVLPIARALKATGHNKIVYMGTAGAFANKGYKVGDLVIPNAVYIGDSKRKIQAETMQIEIAKYGGAVEHVGSPFEETKSWLAMARERSEFVEIETSYLREVFNGKTDNLEMYLLISDILGSDSETLAHATSSKRKNSQNKLLAELFARDTKQPPVPAVQKVTTALEKLKALIEKVLTKKGIAFRYYVFSLLKNKPNVTERVVLETAEAAETFSDKLILDELSRAGEILEKLKIQIPSFSSDILTYLNHSVIDGTWNPKSKKLSLTLVTVNDTAAKKRPLIEELTSLKATSPTLFKNIDIEIDSAAPKHSFTKIPLPLKLDSDVIVKIYTTSAFANYGLTQTTTINGGISLTMLPTKNLAGAVKTISEFISNDTTSNQKSSCVEEVSSILKIIGSF